MAGQPGFCDLDDRYAALSKGGDPLVRLAELVDFEVFRRPLSKALRRSDRARADTAYRSRRHEAFLERNVLTSKVHFRRPPARPMSAARSKANAARSRVRARVEHVFATQKERMGLFVRTIGLAWATTKIGMANLAYNMRRPVWLEARSAPA